MCAQKPNQPTSRSGRGSNQPEVGALVGPRLAVGREPGVASVMTGTKGVTAVETTGGTMIGLSICSGETALRWSGAEL